MAVTSCISCQPLGPCWTVWKTSMLGRTRHKTDDLWMRSLTAAGTTRSVSTTGAASGIPNSCEAQHFLQKPASPYPCSLSNVCKNMPYSNVTAATRLKRWCLWKSVMAFSTEARPEGQWKVLLKEVARCTAGQESDSWWQSKAQFGTHLRIEGYQPAQAIEQLLIGSLESCHVTF